MIYVFLGLTECNFITWLECRVSHLTFDNDATHIHTNSIVIHTFLLSHIIAQYNSKITCEGTYL